jgi:hypothetical protein
MAATERDRRPTGKDDVVGYPAAERLVVDAGHDVTPQAQRSARTAKAHRLVVVASDPDHGDLVTAEAREPAVSHIVRGPGLAGHDQLFR